MKKTIEILFATPQTGPAPRTVDLPPLKFKEYITSCIVDNSGLCNIEFPASLNIPSTQCGVDLFAVALFDDGVYTAMYTAEKFLLNKPVSIVTSTPVDAPIVV